jgi:hypothetical protein
MYRLTAVFSVATVALASHVDAQQPPPRYNVSCPGCPIAIPYGANSLDAFADHTRQSGDALLAEELVAAQTRAERIAGGGVMAGLAVAAAGVLLVPQRCSDIAMTQEPLCDIGRRQLAMMTAGATLAVMGTLYLAIAQPRAEELVARVNVWNRAHPEAPWLLKAHRASGARVNRSDGSSEGFPDSHDTEIIARRQTQSRWLEPRVYVPIMISASCAAAGMWFLAEALEYGRARARPPPNPAPLSGPGGPAPIDPVPGISAAACTTLALGTAAFLALAPRPPVSVQVTLGPGSLGIHAQFP